MRYGVLADIHGNLPALTAAVEAVRARGVDRWIVAGDLVGYGAHPNECVELVASLEAVCVAGNHDLIALGELSGERCIPMARASLRWTRQVLSADARAYLASLPRRAAVDGAIEVAHGSLDDPEVYTASVHGAVAQLERLEEERHEPMLLVLGHTHRPLAVALRRGPLSTGADGVVVLPQDDSTLLNPGGVGQAREIRARARCMVLDTDDGRAFFMRLRYDVRACRRALRAAGLQPGSYRLSPLSLRAAARIGSRVLRARPGRRS